MLIKFLLNGKEINLTSDDIIIESTNFSVDKDGNITCNNMKCNNMQSTNGNFVGGKVLLWGGNKGNANLVVGKTENYYSSDFSEILPGKIFVDNRTSGDCGFYANAGSGGNTHAYLYANNNGGGLTIGSSATSNFCTINGSNSRMTIYGDIYANAYNNNSKEEIKKNIEKFEENAIELLKNSEIYTFNYKTENDTDKKHIGFIIGDKYNTPNEIIANNNEGIDIYSMVSILWKSVQEQQEKIDMLENKIKELEAR